MITYETLNPILTCLTDKTIQTAKLAAGRDS